MDRRVCRAASIRSRRIATSVCTDRVASRRTAPCVRRPPLADTSHTSSAPQSVLLHARLEYVFPQERVFVGVISTNKTGISAKDRDSSVAVLLIYRYDL